MSKRTFDDIIGCTRQQEAKERTATEELQKQSWTRGRKIAEEEFDEVVALMKDAATRGEGYLTLTSRGGGGWGTGGYVERLRELVDNPKVDVSWYGDDVRMKW